jgi:hypothetical protein
MTEMDHDEVESVDAHVGFSGSEEYDSDMSEGCHGAAEVDDQGVENHEVETHEVENPSDAVSDVSHEDHVEPEHGAEDENDGEHHNGCEGENDYVADQSGEEEGDVGNENDMAVEGNQEGNEELPAEASDGDHDANHNVHNSPLAGAEDVNHDINHDPNDDPNHLINANGATSVPDAASNADSGTNGSAADGDSPRSSSQNLHQTMTTSNNLRTHTITGSGHGGQGRTNNPMDAALSDSIGGGNQMSMRRSQQQRPGSGGNSPLSRSGINSNSNSGGNSPRSPRSDQKTEEVFLRADWRHFEPDNMQLIFREQVRRLEAFRTRQHAVDL